MRDFATATVSGRVTIPVRTIGSGNGQGAKTRIACNYYRRIPGQTGQQATFEKIRTRYHTVVAFGAERENLLKAQVGDRLIVINGEPGEDDVKSNTQEGSMRNFYSVVVNDFGGSILIQPKEGVAPTRQSNQPDAVPELPPDEDTNEFVDDTEEDDLPF